ncbi:MAG: alpha/beta hydrolase family protein [Blastocatellia bacterium]
MEIKMIRIAMQFALIGLLALSPAAAGVDRSQPGAGSVRTRMLRLLGLPEQSSVRQPPRAEVLQRATDGEVAIEDLRFEAERGVWVPGMTVKPKTATGRLPVIICLPGTGGTRQQLADARLQLSERPRTGWARALSRQGFLTLSLDYLGSESRGQDVYTDAVRAQLEGRSYMGLMVAEVIRAVDYLSTRPDVDAARIGITGFSLGGAMAWYAAAVDPRLRVIVPVCGGAGTYDDLLKSLPNTRYHSQYFYPAGFLKAFPGDQVEVFAAMAPRALLVVGRDQDQGMPIGGLRKLEEKVKTAYAHRQAADRFAVHVTAGNHTYTDEMFAQVSEWFTRFLTPMKN